MIFHILRYYKRKNKYKLRTSKDLGLATNLANAIILLLKFVIFLVCSQHQNLEFATCAWSKKKLHILCNLSFHNNVVHGK